MIELKIEATDGNDLRKQLQALLGTTSLAIADAIMPEVYEAEDKPTEEKAEDPKPAPTRRKKAEKEPEGNAPANEGTTASSDPATTQDDTSQTSNDGQTASDMAASPSDGEVTIEQIRELTLKVVDQCGKAKIESILSEFGVARATQVAEELRPELAGKLQEALAEVVG